MSEMLDTSPESFEPMGEKQEPILSPEDQTVVEFGLHALRDFLERKNKEELPTIIILVETSARPLYYAIAPIIKKIYAQHQLPLPTFQFFSLSRYPEVDVPQAAAEVDQERLDVLRREIEDLQRRFPRGYGNTPGMPQSREELRKLQLSITAQIGERRLAYTQISGVDRVQKERFQDILNSHTAGEVLIIDDFIREGETLKQIAEMAHNAGERKICFFSFYDARLDPSSSIEVQSGLIREELNGKELHNYAGFRFREREKASVIGVERSSTPEKLTKTSVTKNQRMVQQLRSEMSAIAEQVMSEKDFDRTKVLDALKPEWLEF